NPPLLYVVDYLALDNVLAGSGKAAMTGMDRCTITARIQFGFGISVFANGDAALFGDLFVNGRIFQARAEDEREAKNEHRWIFHCTRMQCRDEPYNVRFRFAIPGSRKSATPPLAGIRQAKSPLL
ncbi:hypothetical protein, partial [Sphingobium sp. Sx8-8]|uniref:hypothetical protein n=1 Tax=Sphingobium sp. Sx8-8 TaxID=2933617 RepID=UPI001F596589